jgi:hypothetical protein
LILDHQLAALEPRKFQLVANRFRAKELDTLVELAVLGFERFEHPHRVKIVHLPPILPHPDCRWNLSRFTASGAAEPPKRQQGSRQGGRFVVYYPAVTR